MVCQTCNSLLAQLALKDQELKDLGSKFSTYKLKSKAKIAQLKQSFAGLTGDEGGKQGDRGELIMRLIEAETQLEQCQDEAELLRNSVALKQTELNDHAIKIRSLEDQLRSSLDGQTHSSKTHPADGGTIASRDLERMHAQLVYKDTRIMELNNTIMEKERQILDLQETCREQGQVVQAKSRAFKIVQQRFMEIDSRTVKEASTETEDTFVDGSSMLPSVSSGSSASLKEINPSRSRDTTPPGHAVMLLRTERLSETRHSPPPVDPSEDRSSLTTETATLLDDTEGTEHKSLPRTLTSLEPKRKPRKKVTFDLPPQAAGSAEALAAADNDIAQAIIDLTSENDELRRIIREMEDFNGSAIQDQIIQLQEEIDRARTEGKNQALKARAAAQGRIRDLEEKIETEQEQYRKKVEELNANIETLQAARQWIIDEKGQLLEQLSANKQKFNEIREELDDSLAENEKLREKLQRDRNLIVRLADNMEEAQRTANLLLEQKVSILGDVERLKEAIEAQDEYIAALETDVVIYEEHIGLLRESLGASKVETRALIKSKAFQTKLKALEQEKEQMAKRNNDERLRIKALNLKIRQLEAENAELLTKLERAEAEVAKAAKGPSEKVLQGTASGSSSNADEATGRSSYNTVIEELRMALRESQNEIARYAKLLNDSLERSDSGARTADASGLSNKQLQIQKDDATNALLRQELTDVRKECEEAHERVQHMEVANFELESKLREVENALQSSQERARKLDLALHEVEREFDFSRKKYSEEISEMAVREKRAIGLASSRAEEVVLLREEARKYRDELEHAKLAMSEMEAVDKQVMLLKDQLELEKASLESKWTEVRVLLMEKEREIALMNLNRERCPSQQWRSGEARSQQNLELHLTMEQAKDKNKQQREKTENDEMEKGLGGAVREMEHRPSEIECDHSSEAFSKELEVLRVKVTDLESQYEAEKINVNLLKTVLVEKEDEIRATEERRNAQEGVLKTVTESLKLKEAEATALEGEIKILISGNRTQNEELKRLTESLECRETEIAALKEELRILISEKASQEQVISANDEEVRRLTEHNKLIEEEKVELEAQLQRLHERLEYLNNKHSAESDALKMEISDLQKKINLLAKERDLEVQKQPEAMAVPGAGEDEEDYKKECLKLKAEKNELERIVRQLNDGVEQDNTTDELVEPNLQSRVESLLLMLKNARKELGILSIEGDRKTDELRREIKILSEQNRALWNEVNISREFRASEQHTCALATSSTDKMTSVVFPAESLLVAAPKDILSPSIINSKDTFEDSAPTSSTVELVEGYEDLQQSVALKEKAETTRKEEDSLQMENLLLRECVTENTKVQESLTADVQQLMLLNAELETAVEVLKGEIWSLNGQLKASLADREELSEKLCEMARLREDEREEARERERELEEQKDVAERSQRQAALAENESNRRLVEWQERSAEMEERREQLEAAYVQLTEYYHQLQDAYTALYTKVCPSKAEAATDPKIDGTMIDGMQSGLDAALGDVERLRVELEQRRLELERRRAELEQLRKLVLGQLYEAQQSIERLRYNEIKGLKLALQENIASLNVGLRASLELVLQKLMAVGADRDLSISNTKCIEAVKQLITEILTPEEELQISYGSLLSLVESAREKIKSKEVAISEIRSAFEEQRKTSQALESRLAQAERNVGDNGWDRDGCSGAQSNVYVCELEEILEATQIALSENIEKCKGLQLKVDQLENRTNEEGRSSETAEFDGAVFSNAASSSSKVPSSSEPFSIRNRTQLGVPTSAQIQLAILAARLTTKVADNDALFRCNAELAHTNVRLQNEIDELREELNNLRMKQHIPQRHCMSTAEHGIREEAVTQSCVQLLDDVAPVASIREDAALTLCEAEEYKSRILDFVPAKSEEGSQLADIDGWSWDSNDTDDAQQEVHLTNEVGPLSDEQVEAHNEKSYRPKKLDDDFKKHVEQLEQRPSAAKEFDTEVEENVDCLQETNVERTRTLESLETGLKETSVPVDAPKRGDRYEKLEVSIGDVKQKRKGGSGKAAFQLSQDARTAEFSKLVDILKSDGVVGDATALTKEAFNAEKKLKSAEELCSTEKVPGEHLQTELNEMTSLSVNVEEDLLGNTSNFPCKNDVVSGWDQDAYDDEVGLEGSTEMDSRTEVVLCSEIIAKKHSSEMSLMQRVEKLKATIRKSLEELKRIINSHEGLKFELSLSSQHYQELEETFESGKMELLTFEEGHIAAQKIVDNEAFEQQKIQELANVKGLLNDELREANRQLAEEKKSLQKLLEGFKAKLSVTEECLVTLKEKNVRFEVENKRLKSELKTMLENLKGRSQSMELIQEKEEKAQTGLRFATTNEDKSGYKIEELQSVVEKNMEGTSAIAKLRKEEKGGIELQPTAVDRQETENFQLGATVVLKKMQKMDESAEVTCKESREARQGLSNDSSGEESIDVKFGELSEELKKIQGKLEEAYEEKKELEREAEQYKLELQRFKETALAEAEDNVKLKTSLASLELLTKRLEGELSDAKKQVEGQKKLEMSIAGLKHELQESQQLCEVLKNELAGSQKEDRILNEELSFCRKEIQKLSDEQVLRERISEDIHRELEAVRKKNELLLESEYKLMEKAEELEKQITKLEEEKHFLEKEINQLKGKLKKEKQLRKEWEMNKAEMEECLRHAETQFESHEEFIASLSNEHEQHLQETKLEYKKLLDEKEEAILTLRDECIRLRSVQSSAAANTSDGALVNELIEKLKNFEARQQEFAGVEAKNEKLLIQISALEEKCEKLVQERTQLVQKIKNMQIELSTLKEKSHVHQPGQPMISEDVLKLHSSSRNHSAAKKPSSSSFHVLGLPEVSSQNQRCAPRSDSCETSNGEATRQQGNINLGATLQQLQTSNDEAVRRRKLLSSGAAKRSKQ